MRIPRWLYFALALILSIFYFYFNFVFAKENASISSFNMKVCTTLLVVNSYLKLMYLWYEAHIRRFNPNPSEFLYYFFAVPMVIPSFPYVSPYDFFSKKANRTNESDFQSIRHGIELLLQVAVYFVLFLIISFTIKGPAMKTLYLYSKNHLEFDLITLFMLVIIYIHYYLFRYILPQLAIALFRILGHQIHPNFVSPLLSRSYLDFWSRWNFHKKKFLENLVFFPVYLNCRRLFLGKYKTFLSLSIGVFSVFIVGLCTSLLNKFFFIKLASIPISPIELILRISAYEGSKFFLIYLSILSNPIMIRIRKKLGPINNQILDFSGVITTILLKAVTFPILLFGNFSTPFLKEFFHM